MTAAAAGLAWLMAVSPALAQQAADPRWACDDKPVFMVIDGETIDRARMEDYTRALLKSGLYAALGGYYLNSPRPIETFEGDTVVNHATLVVRFPCAGNARTFWYSRTYQETIRPLRLNPTAGNFTVRIYAEIGAPAYMAGKVGDNRYTQAFPAGGIATTPLPSATQTGVVPAPVVRRTTLVVANLDRALALYRDILGFTASEPRALPPGSSGHAIFNLPRGERARFVTLDAGQGQPQIVGLIESPSYRPRPRGTRPDALVVKIPVPIDSVTARIAESGATLMSPTLAGTNREQGLIDRDGHLVVLYELPR